MKNFFLSVVITSFLILNLVYGDGLRTSDVCYLDYSENNSSEANQGIDCFNKYPYRCGPIHCTTNKNSCLMLYMWFQSIGRYTNKKEHQQRLDNYLKFFNTIKPCPRYKFETNDLCLNGLNCFYIHKIPYRLANSKFNLIERKECSCIGIYNYKCNKNYCSNNKLACDVVNNTNNDSKINSEIKNCDNDHRKVTKKN